MRKIDQTAIANEKFWGREVEKGGGHTLPWIDIDLDELHRYIRGELGGERLLGRKEPRRMLNMAPEDLSALGEIDGKDVLCLSCGGGQQSAVFALLGARVTVVDITQGQLAGDKAAADHYGYEVETVHADMRDLSALAADAFDIVYAMTPCYVPSIREVYAQVAGVLKSGGLYRTDLGKPSLFAIEYDGGGYRIGKPYCESVQHREDGPVEHRHYLDDIFNGLADNGLALLHVGDRGRHKQPPPDAPLGSYTHEDAWIGGGFTILATKQDVKQ